MKKLMSVVLLLVSVSSFAQTPSNATRGEARGGREGGGIPEIPASLEGEFDCSITLDQQIGENYFKLESTTKFKTQAGRDINTAVKLEDLNWTAVIDRENSYSTQGAESILKGGMLVMKIMKTSRTAPAASLYIKTPVVAPQGSAGDMIYSSDTVLEKLENNTAQVKAKANVSFYEQKSGGYNLGLKISCKATAVK